MVYLIYGPYIYTYQTFAYALKTVAFFILGDLATEKLILTNSFVAVVWSYIFYFFLIFVFLSLFMAVFIVNFENVNTYPEDWTEDQYTWGYSDYVLWILKEWAPERI
jgi:hypothetical protein